MSPRQSPALIGGALLLLLAASACAGSGPTTNPTPAAGKPLAWELPVPTDPASGAGIAMGTLSIDTVAQTVSLNQASQAQLDFPLDITPYLTLTPCFDCFRAHSVSWGPSGTVEIELGLRHPFNLAQRPDLDAFDARMILGASPNQLFTRLPNTRDGGTVKLNQTLVTNPDGWTQHLSTLVGTSPTGTVNPYIDFATENNPDPNIDGAQIPFHRFAAGAAEDLQVLRLNLGAGPTQIDLNWVIEAHYGQAATKPTRFTPIYRNPQFNRKEAFSLTTAVLNNTLKEGLVDSSATVRVSVADWQQGAPIVIDPGNPGVAEIDAPSDVSRIVLDLPTLLPTAVERDTPDSGAGTLANPFIYNIDVTSDGTILEGNYLGCVMEEDELNPFSTTFEYRVYRTVTVSVLPADPPVGKGVWEFTTPAAQVSNQPGLSYLWPKEAVALDSTGLVHVVWTDDTTGTDTAYYARQTGVGATTFTAPEPFTGSDAATLYPTIAIDSTDVIHIAWEDGRDQVNGSNIYYGTRTVGASAMSSTIPVTTHGENVFAIFPKVIATLPGAAHIAWSDHRTDPQVFPFSGGANWGVFYAQISLPTTSTPSVAASATVADGPTAEGYPNLVLKGTSVHVAYQENAIPGTGDRNLYHAAGFGSTFGTSVEIVALIQDAGQPDIAVDSAGTLWVAYIRGSSSDRIDMTSSVDDGANWLASSTVSQGGTTGYHQYSPDLTVDSLDNLHFVWHEYSATSGEPGRVQYRRLDFDAEWHDTEFLTSDTDQCAFASIAADPVSKNLGIVYQRLTASQYEVFYQLGLYIAPP